MGIRFYCPNGHKLNVKEFQAGRKGICPFCGSKIMIPTHSTRGATKGKKKRKHAAQGEEEEEVSPAPEPADETAGEGAVTAAAPAQQTPATEGIQSAASSSIAVQLAPAAQPEASSQPSAPSQPAIPAPQPVYPAPPPPVLPVAPAPTPVAAQVAPAPLPSPVQTVQVAMPTGPTVAAGTTTAETASPGLPHGAVPGSPAGFGSAPVSSAAPPGPAPSAPQPPAPDPIAESPEMIWYVRPPTGGQFGPAAGDLMRTWLAEGRVSADSLVWREGWRDWLPAGDVFPQLRMDSTIAMLGAMAAETPPSSVNTSHRPRHRRKASDSQAVQVLLWIVAVVILAAVFLWVLFKP
jgi:hypothetical protein